MPTRQGLLATTALHGCVGLLLFVSSPALDNAGTIRAAAPTDPTSAVQSQALDLCTMNTAGCP
ncbi:hypothetical protein [Azospirillum brasilense]|uniref:hypothetical protein n=1 Tax=Azospirillum brasilense TaxID=192 RepID=UPI000E0B9F1F|nr:hypothetical protein [Azospirillum brasilense]